MEKFPWAIRPTLTSTTAANSEAKGPPGRVSLAPYSRRGVVARSSEFRPRPVVVQQTAYRAVGKRVFDIAMVVAALPVVLPVVLGLAAVLSSDGGSPFFVHRRIGKDGRTFGCLKLRTMVADAETRLADLLARDPDAAAEWSKSRKLLNDPRVTRFGNIVRKLSLDELPQLWNVLRGDMSLVGPRPVVADELSHYGEYAAAYKAVRPGITGAWQVSGRNSISYERRVALDVEYVRKHNFRTDLAIIAKTALEVVRRSGV